MKLSTINTNMGQALFFDTLSCLQMATALPALYEDWLNEQQKRKLLIQSFPQ